MRRLRDLMSSHIADLGGERDLSHAERVLVQRASMLALQCELFEKKFIEDGGPASMRAFVQYMSAINCARRVLETLGLKRRARPVPDLASYLARKNGHDGELIDATEE